MALQISCKFQDLYSSCRSLSLEIFMDLLILAIVITALISRTLTTDNPPRHTTNHPEPYTLHNLSKSIFSIRIAKAECGTTRTSSAISIVQNAR
jgi:hypothetical protein